MLRSFWPLREAHILHRNTDDPDQLFRHVLRWKRCCPFQHVRRCPRLSLRYSSLAPSPGGSSTVLPERRSWVLVVGRDESPLSITVQIIVSPRLAGRAPCFCILYDTRLDSTKIQAAHFTTRSCIYFIIYRIINQLQSAHAGMVLHIVILRRCTFDTRVIREDPHCFGRGRMDC